MADSRRVTVMLTLKTVAVRCGMKYDAILTAVRSGRLRVRNAAEKPGGFLIALVTEADMRAFKAQQVAFYRGRKSDYDQAKLKKMRAVDARVPMTTVEEVMRPRPTPATNGTPGVHRRHLRPGPAAPTDP